MYKVVIFGTGKTSRVLESGLNNQANIIAYCDNDNSKWQKKIRGKNVISPKELININYDFILIASQYNDSIFEQLINLGINEKKIFQFFKFVNLMDNIFLRRIQILDKDVEQIDMLVTGISYAQKGIDINKFSKKAFNFAWGSQDLYYDYHLVRYLLEKYKDRFIKLNYMIIGLCYYSFEYDLSLSSMRNRVSFYYDVLGLEHHTEDIKKILNYKEIGKDIAQKIFKLDSDGIIQLDWLFNKQEVYPLNKEIGKNQAKVDGNKNYPETVKENAGIFYNYLELLHQHNIKPIVVVFPTSKYYSDYFPKRLKKQFYEIINEAKSKSDFQFVDYFDSDEFSDDDFYDVSHLNSNGAAKFSSILDNIIEW